MAIAFDTSSYGKNTNTSPITFSHTCTGSNLILFVGVTMRAPSGTPTCSGVTYNGVSMTSLGAVDSSGTIRVYLFYLINPATGANDVSASFSGLQADTDCVVGASSFSGVTQTDPINVSGSANNSGGTSSITKALTTTVDNCWIFNVVGGNNMTVSVKYSETSAYNQLQSLYCRGAGAYKSTTTAGSVNTGWDSGSGSNDMVIWAAAFKPAIDSFIPKVMIF
jgi:hypothetical protein